MTRLDIDAPAPAAESRQAELRSFMAKASKAAVELAAIITPQIEVRRLDTAQALIAVLLYAAHFARKAGGTAKDFMDSAEQAFADSEELFATDVVEVLRAARTFVARGWCQGGATIKLPTEMAMKWVKDASLPELKRLVGCHVDDKYASRWSLLGAIEHSADARSNRERARAAVVLAIRDAGWQFKPGSLDVTVINEYNDHGWGRPPPKLVLPEEPPADAPAEAVDSWKATVGRMQHDYETIVVPQWPKAAVPGRTREEVLAVLDRAIAISEG